MNKEKIKNILFYMAYFLMIFLSMFSRIPIIEENYKMIESISLGLLIFTAILQSHKLKNKELMIMILIMLAVLMSYVFSGDPIILKLFLVIYSSKSLDFNDFIKKDLYVKLIFFIIVIILHFNGLTVDYIMYRSDGTMRNSMGFSHPNIFGLYIFMFCMELVYLKRNKLKLYDYAIVICLLLVIYNYSDSRASIVSLVLLIILLLTKNFLIKYVFSRKVTKFFVQNSFLIFTIITYIATILYSNNYGIGKIMNTITSNRISSICYFLDNYGINLFGKKLYLVSTEKSVLLNIKAYILDNCYFNLLIKHGAIIFLIIFLITRKMFEKLYHSKKFSLIIIFLVLLVYGLMENSIFKITYTPFLLYFGNVLYSKKESDKYE